MKTTLVGGMQVEIKHSIDELGGPGAWTVTLTDMMDGVEVLGARDEDHATRLGMLAVNHEQVTASGTRNAIRAAVKAAKAAK